MPNVKVVNNMNLKSNGKMQSASTLKVNKSSIKPVLPNTNKNTLNDNLSSVNAVKPSASEPKETKEIEKVEETSATTETKSKFNLREFFKKKLIEDNESSQVYALDQNGLESIIDAIATALSEKFVSKDEVEKIVEHTIQKMVVNNNVNDVKSSNVIKVKKVNHPVVPKKVK